MDLPLLSAVFAAFSITMYGLLDGFDLGVGALLLLQPHEASRNHMVDRSRQPGTATKPGSS